MSEQARQEAEKRWPPQTDNWNLTNYTYNGVRVFIRDAFVEGAEWQASQPVEVTDEMVERGLIELLIAEQERRGAKVSVGIHPDDFRIALEAALGRK